MSISSTKAAEAYDAALLRCKELRFYSYTRRTIAAAFDGAYCTKAIESKIAPLFPGDRVHYYSASYSGDKYIVITRTTASSTPIRTEIRLCRKGEKRVNVAELLETAERNEERLALIESSLELFYENLAQYNVLSDCLDSVRNRIASVMYCLDRFSF